MVDEPLRYDRMVERALRGVVREALTQVAERGLPGDHHFYLTFSTEYPGVDLPPYLRHQYPQEMTIVLQYQYYGLEVSGERFSVTLSFSNKHERLVIPFAAITTFADPSVNFILQFQPVTVREPALPEPIEPAPAEPSKTADEPAKPKDGAGKIVTLDSFRKK